MAGRSAPFIAAPAFSIVPQRDQELLELGKRLNAAWFHKLQVDRASDKQIDALVDAGSPIVHRIATMRATTLAGLSVKAKAFSWCWGGAPPAVSQIAGKDSVAGRILVSLLQDLLAN
jgi:hypothetical protein